MGDTEKVELDRSEYDKLVAENEELKEKNKSSTQEWQRNFHKLKFHQNPAYISDLIASDKKVALEIAKEYGYENLDEFVEAVKWVKGVDNAEKEVSESLDGYLQEKWVDKESDFWKDVLKLYAELTEGVKLTPKVAKALAREAYLDAKKTSKHFEDYKQKMEEVKLAGTSSWKAKESDKKPTIQVNKRIKFSEIYWKKD